MDKRDYSISELIEDFENIQRVKITPRQIHFYRNKGIIPKPEGKGGGARYTEEHYLRLLFTKKLIENHKISWIKDELDRLCPKGMKVDTKIQSLREALGQAPVEKEIKRKPRSSDELEEHLQSNYSFLNLIKKSSFEEPLPSRIRPISKSFADGETWHKFKIADGIELNISGEKLRSQRKEILRMIQMLKKYV